MSEEKKRFKKVKYVTRSFDLTSVTTLCMDVNTAESTTQVYELEGSYKDDKKLLNHLRDTYESDEFKIVAITSTEKKAKILGIPLNLFIELATELDPETRQAYEREEY